MTISLKRTIERYIETPSADIAAYKLFIYDMYQIYNGAIKPDIHSLHELAAYRQHKAYLGRSAQWLRQEPAGSDYCTDWLRLSSAGMLVSASDQLSVP